MTRVNGFVVVLEKDADDDATKEILIAIGRIRGVLSVSENKTPDAISEFIMSTRLKHQLFQHLVDLYK